MNAFLALVVNRDRVQQYLALFKLVLELFCVFNRWQMHQSAHHFHRLVFEVCPLGNTLHLRFDGFYQIVVAIVKAKAGKILLKCGSGDGTALNYEAARLVLNSVDEALNSEPVSQRPIFF